MKLAIMQPYFMPYIGYFQLIAAADRFVVYDNIKYTKKGWINRNRFLQNGKDCLFSVPLKSDSDFLNVDQRIVSPDFNREKLLNQIREAYRRAPHFSEVFPVFEKIVIRATPNLFEFLHGSILDICRYLGIKTEIVVSSRLAIDHSLSSAEKVLTLCKVVGADVYVNAIGGKSLYSKDMFAAYGVELFFLESKPFSYTQFENEFVPWLSIIDVMMFNSRERICEYLSTGYELV